MPLRILVVDDSEIARKILRLMLGSRDWVVCEAENGWSGVEKFEEHKPDVVVLDLAMPGMDGIAIARMMSIVDPRVPIILFAIFGFEGLKVFAIEAGIRDVVPKNNAWSLIPQIENLVRRDPSLVA